jgi:hypothetical protein
VRTPVTRSITLRDARRGDGRAGPSCVRWAEAALRRSAPTRASMAASSAHGDRDHHRWRAVGFRDTAEGPVSEAEQIGAASWAEGCSKQGAAQILDR